MSYMEVQDQLWVFYAMRFGSGVAVVLGVALFIYSVLMPRTEVIEPGPHERVPAE
jgi:nitric oxide reductase subunit B